MKKTNRLTLFIILGMILGIITGYIVFTLYAGDQAAIKKFADNISILTDIFLRLVKMIIAPLVFSTLVVGVAKLGDIKAVGRIGGKTMLWFITATFVSLFLGLLLVNVLQPGHSLNLPLPDSHAASGVSGSDMTLRGFFRHVFPDSVIMAMSQNEILQIVVFALFFEVAMAAVGGRRQPVI